MNWILFGFKGSGKTYFGKRLGLPFIDTDVLIEKKEKMSIRELIQKKGEKYFRFIERKIISDLKVNNHIISVGGGTVLISQNLIHLQKLGKLIYLKCSKSILKKRMLTPPFPTFLNPKNPEHAFEMLFKIRVLKYEKIPAYHIHLEGKEDKQILEELWQVIDSEISFASQLGENHTVEQLES